MAAAAIDLLSVNTEQAFQLALSPHGAPYKVRESDRMQMKSPGGTQSSGHPWAVHDSIPLHPKFRILLGSQETGDQIEFLFPFALCD